jgi:hypothetical protein
MINTRPSTGSDMTAPASENEGQADRGDRIGMELNCVAREISDGSESEPSLLARRRSPIVNGRRSFFRR